MPCALRRGVVQRRATEPLDPSALSDDIRQQWRELGFLYDVDGDAKAWVFRGSSGGLHGLVRLLRAYASTPGYSRDSEHQHHGPYSYLTFVTAPAPTIDGRSISGPQWAFAQLADVIETKLSDCEKGDVLVIGNEWCKETEWRLLMRVESDGWDPALHDPYNG